MYQNNTYIGQILEKPTTRAFTAVQVPPKVAANQNAVDVADEIHGAEQLNRFSWTIRSEYRYYLCLKSSGKGKPVNRFRLVGINRSMPLRSCNCTSLPCHLTLAYFLISFKQPQMCCNKVAFQKFLSERSVTKCNGKPKKFLFPRSWPLWGLSGGDWKLHTTVGYQQISVASCVKHFNIIEHSADACFSDP